MGWNFRKSVKIFPGVKLNFGKNTTSVSIGGKYGGVTVNSKGDVTTRSSIPGTGISRTQKLTASQRKAATQCSKSSSQKKMYVQMAENDLRIIRESSILVDETSDPGVFFSRMDILFERYAHLASIEQHLPLSGEKPSTALQKLQDGFSNNTNEFIKKYFANVDMKAKSLKTATGKRNRIAKAYEALMEYKGKLDASNIALADYLRDKYLQECG